MFWNAAPKFGIESFDSNAIHELISDGLGKFIPESFLSGIQDLYEEIMKTFLLLLVIQCFKIFQKSFPEEF